MWCVCGMCDYVSVGCVCGGCVCAVCLCVWVFVRVGWVCGVSV